MRKIHLKTMRDMRHMKMRVASIWFLVAVVVFVYAGGFMARESLYHTRDRLTDQLRLADVQVLFTPASPDEMPDLTALERQAAIVKRLDMPGGMELKDGRPLSCLVIYLDPQGHPSVNDIRIIEGSFLSPDDENGVVIEKSLADIHGYRIGDTISLNMLFPMDLTVRGIAVTPECLITPANPRIPVPSKGSLGIIFASMRLVEKTFGYPLYNDLAFKLYDPGKLKNFQAGLTKRLPGLDIKQIMPKEAQFGYHFLTRDLEQFNIVIAPVVLIFVLIAGIVIVLTFSRLIVNQKKQIGIAMALGYTYRAILGSYLLLAVILGLGGALLGALVSFEVNIIYATIYGRIVGLPEVLFTVTWRHIFTGALIGLVLALAAASFPLKRLRRLSPQVVIREESETVMHGLLKPLRPLEGAITRLSGPSLGLRIGLRNIFRRPRLVMATVLLIALAVSQSTAFLIILSSFEHQVDSTSRQECWDAIVGFRSPLQIKDAQAVAQDSGVKDYELALSGFARLRYAGGYTDLRVIGLPLKMPYRTINLKQGRLFERQDEMGMLYNNSLAKQKFKVGDKVMIETAHGSFALRVVGLIEEFTTGQIYLPLDTAEKILGLKGKRTGFLTTFGQDPRRMEKRFYQNELVEHVTLKADIMKTSREIIANIRIILDISLAISILISLMLLFASVTVNILDRKLEYATLQSLGLPEKTLIKSIYIELACEIVLALGLSVPISIVLAAYFNYALSEAWPTITTYLKITDFLLVMIPAVIILPLAAVPGIRTLMTMNIAECLRSRSFG
ncbi:MAG: FtsX-like permease family protein [Syntrophaceae bacterium]